MPRSVPRMKSEYRTLDAPTTMFVNVKGAGTLRAKKTASVPLRFSARVTRAIR